MVAQLDGSQWQRPPGRVSDTYRSRLPSDAPRPPAHPPGLPSGFTLVQGGPEDVDLLQLTKAERLR